LSMSVKPFENWTRFWTAKNTFTALSLWSRRHSRRPWFESRLGMRF
jgi:hypothetical protein